MVGCDIHTYIERKIDGEWHMITPIIADYGKEGGDGHGWGDMRDYDFFAHLAGVRAPWGTDNDYPEPLGLPHDVSKVTRWYSDKWGVDGHSHSWASVKDFVDKKLAILAIRSEADGAHSREYYEWRVLSYEICEDEDKDLYRVVFWFDN